MAKRVGHRVVNKYGDYKIIPEPWSAEREIEAFRDKVALNWEWPFTTGREVKPRAPMVRNPRNVLSPIETRRKAPSLSAFHWRGRSMILTTSGLGNHGA